MSLTPPGAEGEWEWLDDSHFGMLFLPERLLKEAAVEVGQTTTALRPQFAVGDPLVSEVFRALVEESTRSRRSSRLLVSSAALFLSAHLLKRYGADLVATEKPDRAIRGKRLSRVLEAIEGRLDHDWSIHELASVAGLTPFRFAHAFRDAVGISPRRYVQQQRLECARRLLGDSDLSVIEVAFRCGFESHSWFTTSFKRRYGAPPSAFRRRLRTSSS